MIRYLIATILLSLIQSLAVQIREGNEFCISQNIPEGMQAIITYEQIEKRPKEINFTVTNQQNQIFYQKHVNQLKDEIVLPQSNSNEPYELCLKNASNYDNYKDDLHVFFKFKEEFFEEHPDYRNFVPLVVHSDDLKDMKSRVKNHTSRINYVEFMFKWLNQKNKEIHDKTMSFEKTILNITFIETLVIFATGAYQVYYLTLFFKKKNLI